VRRSNCFVFALVAWWRWRKRGAYWWLRESRHIAGWHWGVHYRGRFIHYEPVAPRRGWLSAAMHKVWYRGVIKRGD
jgi:hypothetical protein